MHIGMLWFDDTANTALKSKVEAAIDHYRKKYHREPNLCLVHPSMLADGLVQVGKITVRAYRPVLPGHLWIGVEDQN